MRLFAKVRDDSAETFVLYLRVGMKLGEHESGVPIDERTHQAPSHIEIGMNKKCEGKTIFQQFLSTRFASDRHAVVVQLLERIILTEQEINVVVGKNVRLVVLDESFITAHNKRVRTLAADYEGFRLH